MSRYDYIISRGQKRSSTNFFAICQRLNHSERSISRRRCHQSVTDKCHICLSTFCQQGVSIDVNNCQQFSTFFFTSYFIIFYSYVVFRQKFQFVQSILGLIGCICYLSVRQRICEHKIPDYKRKSPQSLCETERRSSRYEFFLLLISPLSDFLKKSMVFGLPSMMLMGVGSRFSRCFKCWRVPKNYQVHFNNIISYLFTYNKSLWHPLC